MTVDIYHDEEPEEQILQPYAQKPSPQPFWYIWLYNYPIVTVLIQYSAMMSKTAMVDANISLVSFSLTLLKV